MNIKTFYRRNLPHITLNQKAYFITFWLHRSIPTDVMNKLKSSYDAEQRLLLNIKEVNFRKKKIYDLQKSTLDYLMDIWINQNAKKNI